MEWWINESLTVYFKQKDNYSAMFLTAEKLQRS